MEEFLSPDKSTSAGHVLVVEPNISSPRVTLPQAYGLVWRVTRGLRLRIVVATVLALAVSTLMVVGPYLMSQFFQVFQLPATSVGGHGGDRDEPRNLARPRLSVAIPLLTVRNHEYLRVTPSIVLALAAGATLAAALAGVGHAWFEEGNRQLLVRRVKEELYKNIHRCHVLDPHRPAGELLGVIGQAETIVGLVSFLFITPLSVGWQLGFAVLMMGIASWWLTAIYLTLLLSITLVLPRVLGLDRRVNAASSLLRDASMDEGSILIEQLAARDLIQALSVQDAAERRAAGQFARTASAHLRMVLTVQYRGLTTVLAGISFPIMVWIGAKWDANLSHILEIWLLSGAVTGAMQGLAGLYSSWHQTQPNLAFAKNELERQTPAIETRRLFTRPPVVIASGLEADLPDGTPILKGITFEAPAGRLTAIVGRGGTGKSVLLDVIAGRFRGAVRGEISIDDIKYPARELIGFRNQIPRLNQTPQLLRISVNDFLLFGVDGSPARTVQQALDLVGLGAGAPTERRLQPDDIISVDRQLSGLQQQCLRLGQLLIRNRPQLLLLDEPDSAMSPEDAALVQQAAIGALTPASTVLMVTHASHLLPPDTGIVFLKDGRVEGAGTHRELLEASRGYRRLMHELGQVPGS